MIPHHFLKEKLFQYGAFEEMESGGG